MRSLLAELNTALARRLPCVYCAVVETRGSTPQKAGAAMLVYPDGSQAGTLGGGCVEAEVKRRALHGLNDTRKPEVLAFCLDDDYGWDDGLICGGRMTILAQPLTSDGAMLDLAARYYHHLHDLAARGSGYTEAVVIGDALGLPIGDRYLFDSEGKSVTQLAERPAWETIAAHLAPLHRHPKPGTRQGIAYMPAQPRITLLLVGGGHVGQAVAKLASEVGFDIWILDDRDKFASPERFPTASRRIVGDIGTTLRDLAPTLTPHTFAVILTRGHNHDEEALYHLAPTACSYVGMIGSKRKIRMIFEDLVAKGIASEALERVHAPLGYNIGSQTVPEIAVSIVAELIACRNVGGTDAARWSWSRK
ncbi:MAG: XdhC family protein [Planctomycetia bacterium]|nr:XdhC family protein [Planctomycetia bacterium]